MDQDQAGDPKKCPECGADLRSEAMFCWRCGARQSQSERQDWPPAPASMISRAGDPNVITRVQRSQSPAAERFIDPSLGDSLVFGPSLRTLLSMFGIGVLLVGICIGIGAPVEKAWWVVAFGLAYGLIGLWAAQSSLVVGTEGFRYSWALR